MTDSLPPTTRMPSSDEAIDKVLFSNFLRVFRAACG